MSNISQSRHLYYVEGLGGIHRFARFADEVCEGAIEREESRGDPICGPRERGDRDPVRVEGDSQEDGRSTMFDVYEL